MASQLSRKRALDPPAIPDRLYFKIGDVAQLCGVEPYVLRFWEKQFPQLKPNKSGTGQRLYRRRDVEMALEIKRLVHGEGYTLSGARQALAQAPRNPEPKDPQKPKQSSQPVEAAAAGGQEAEVVASTVAEVRAGLQEIAAMLVNPTGIQPPSGRQLRRRQRNTTPTAQTESLFPL